MLEKILHRFAISKPDPMINPFAQQGDAVDPIDDPNNSKDVTLQRGFTAPYSKLKKDGGKYVGRAEMNGIIKWLSRFVCYQNYGGQYSFEQKIADAGGYPKDAVLFDATRRMMLVSLKDNNTDNFLKDPSVIGKTWGFLQDNKFPDIQDDGKGNVKFTQPDGKPANVEVTGKLSKPTVAIKDNDTSKEVATNEAVATYVKNGNSGNLAGDLKYSMQKTDHPIGNGMWMKCDGRAIPAQYKETIALVGANLPNIAGRVLAMANATHLSKSNAGADNVAVVLPQHTHTGTHVHTHPVSQTEHTHPLLQRRPNGGNSGGGDTINQSSNPQDNTRGSSANITPTNPNDSNLTIQNAGTPNAQMSVIQPTYYVENIFMYCM